MCGILGIAACAGSRPSVGDDVVVRLRDRMTHRGPDDAGLWRRENVVLAHRRLAVIDPTPAGHQPMVAANGRAALVYNGELYNDAEVRADLLREGVTFRTSSDTETVLAALGRWGPDAMRRLQGMYALGFVDLDAQRLVLARDPLGIKPLYYTLASVDGRREIAFASEIPVLLGHPRIAPRPDLAAVSGYLTTIRTTLGPRTLFAGIGTVLPGEWIVVDLSGEQVRLESRHWWDGAGLTGGTVREAVEDSVARHLRSDVPSCCLLSGGLDSSIIVSIARKHDPGLTTYCSGARSDGDSDDFAFARRMAERLGTHHVEAPVTRELFARRWQEMVEQTGVPLSTPNEVAINEVTRRLRQDGKIVTLSGEGADELFGGYDTVLEAASRHVTSLGGAGGEWRERGGEFHLEAGAWVPRSMKSALLSEPAARAIERDAVLSDWYSAEFRRTADQRDEGDPLQAHLRFLRRVNLAGLLLRLDSATMLESVEGRTPLADQQIALLAESLPMDAKCRLKDGSAGGVMGTKVALREAFARVLPSEIVTRAKASFPLPFQDWVKDQAGALAASAFARELFSEAAVATVAGRPGELWQLAWPMINLALWGRRWWG